MVDIAHIYIYIYGKTWVSHGKTMILPPHETGPHGTCNGLRITHTFLVILMGDGVDYCFSHSH